MQSTTTLQSNIYTDKWTSTPWAVFYDGPLSPVSSTSSSENSESPESSSHPELLTLQYPERKTTVPRTRRMENGVIYTYRGNQLIAKSVARKPKPYYERKNKIEGKSEINKLTPFTDQLKKLLNPKIFIHLFFPIQLL
ncbi:hypothetical protein L3Y34_003009 [Caenorhabditis briggsae]|uniref:Uncharacterized protein n=1 Tax=Caenorhabditis briggsae TaxID=6238 RepID=A0AAE9A822_CAEBR|nr:hypothetical protein L3Y34_003009 [Caenorhabditis briggsae]